jgi:hypothetical protein
MELAMNTLRTSWELGENIVIFNPKNSNLPFLEFLKEKMSPAIILFSY